MAFNDFKQSLKSKKKFRITYTEKDFFGAEEATILPSEQFIQELNFADDTLMFSHPRQHAVRDYFSYFKGNLQTLRRRLRTLDKENHHL